ncbi:unnamed protein product [Notodromas monacha]|uniref:Uncharacterized protein n=1 Tax=Notodromas monacha TaxID=399045 RepID=A0A7R9GEU5_9CRUS|nr:unnamed protein product [Notodromas monacha]CAG0920006.1 unnamed protein product [Notodromas monacha]
MATARSRSWSPRKESNPYPVGGDDGSVPDRGFGLSDHPRAKDYPLCGENEESIPDLGFGLRGLSAGGRRVKAGPEVGTDDASVPDLGFGLKEKRAGESKEKGAGVEDVIKPKKAYVLGSESKPVPHIRTQDCSRFLGDLKASVEVVHRTASERRASISGPKSTGDGDTATNKSSARDGYTTDTCSDDDLDDSSVLENLASDAVDVREAIEGMEAQLPKLPKINRFLAAIATNSVPTIQEPKTECSLSPPIFDAIVQSVDAFQVIMETVIEQGSGLNISGVLNRGKAVGKASSLAEFEAVRGEIGATLDKLGLLTGLAVECKGALEAIGASVEAAMVSMNGEQRKQMVEDLGAFKER